MSFQFPSALAGCAVLASYCHAQSHPASTFAHGLQCASLRFSAEHWLIRIRLVSRSLATQHDDFRPIHQRPPDASHASTPFCRAMFRYSRAWASQPGRIRIADNSATGSLISRWGKALAALFCNREPGDARTYPRGRIEHPARAAPKTVLRPTITSGCGVGDSTDGTHGVFTPFAGLIPITGGAMFPSAGPACRFFDCSPRLIFVAEPSVPVGDQMF